MVFLSCVFVNFVVFCIYATWSRPVSGSDFCFLSNTTHFLILSQRNVKHILCTFKVWQKPQQVREETWVHLVSVFSVKYLVIVKVVRQASYKQFVGGIRNDCGHDAYGDDKQTKHFLYHIIQRAVTWCRSVTNLGRGKRAALRYQVKADSREVF